MTVDQRGFPLVGGASEGLPWEKNKDIVGKAEVWLDLDLHVESSLSLSVAKIWCLKLRYEIHVVDVDLHVSFLRCARTVDLDTIMLRSRL